MYADEDARGGVLEPEGIVNIKYRLERQLETMARLDPTYADLKRQLADKSLTSDQQSDIKVKMTEREQNLLPVYMQIALQFADLHDRAGRMQAKGTIRFPLRWKEARRFFYWRLRRRLSEELILRRLNTTSSAARSAPRDQHINTLKLWTGMLDAEFEKDDRKVAMWYEENRKMVNGKIDKFKADGVTAEIVSILTGGISREGGLEGVRQVLGMLPLEEREGVIKFLTSS